MKQQQREVLEQLGRLGEEQKLTNTPPAPSREWQQCVDKLEQLKLTTQQAIDRFSTLEEEKTRLSIIRKYLACSSLLQTSIQQLQDSLDKDRSLWDAMMLQQSVQAEREWTKQSASLVDLMEASSHRISHITSSLQMFTLQEKLSLCQYAEEQLQNFSLEVQLRTQERLEAAFSRFEWPTPNHKLEQSLLPLQLEFGRGKETAPDQVHKHPVNSLLFERDSAPIITQIDDRLQLFVVVFLIAIRLQRALSSTGSKEAQKTGSGQMRSTGVWALDYLFAPVVGRFNYHFADSHAATNQLKKPEWTFSFVANLISDHAEFFLVYVQPLLNLEYASSGSSALSIPDAKSLFICQLVEALEDKLLRDIPLLLAGKQSLYCHTICEAVRLQKLLFDVHSYSGRSPMDAFAYNSELFEAWIKIERHGTISLLPVNSFADHHT